MGEGYINLSMEAFKLQVAQVSALTENLKEIQAE
jgi:hypothetical protein